MVLLCFTFVAVRPVSVTHREGDKKDEIVPQIINHVQDQNVDLEEEKLKTIAEMVYDESVRCNVDYRLVLAIMKVESNFKDDAVSEQGARGLLQVKPSLAKYIASDAGVKWRGDKTLDEPDKNIKIGVHFFSRLVEDFDENIHMALHAYHVGPTRLRAILTEKKKPGKYYLNLVLDEYKRNRTILPPP
ncbi:MAG: lytic murein transglycosylase [Syntrophorhabdus sp. PtaU1.Bin050]|nr:MAG: lytic murein transglycosylase [Syntrophorhabdus sp. PtaU1.Bin050]